MPRKACGPRKTTTKQEQRAAARQQKQLEKNEKTFACAVHASRASILDDDYRFIEATLSANTAWISPLAGLIRSGSLNGLLKEHVDPGAGRGHGDRWKGRVNKITALPCDMMVHMLTQGGVELTDSVVQQQDVVRNLFRAQFWVSESVSLPKTTPDIRFVSSLTKIAKMRLDHVGRNWLGGLNASSPISMDAYKSGEYDLWQVEGDDLFCRAFSQDNDGQLARKFVAGGYLRVALPTLQEDHWVLSNKRLPECRIYPSKSPGSNFDFLAVSFFDKVLPPDERWTYDLQSEEVEETTTATDAASSGGA